MCIRDSLSTEEKRSLEDFEQDANAYGFPQVLKAFGYTPIPVSYTHLRAHETVLDLVCRLLLEKTKTI